MKSGSNGKIGGDVLNKEAGKRRGAGSGVIRVDD